MTRRGAGEPVSNTQIAYERIRQAIVEGRYPAGARLIEQRIAEESGLSRTPIREALRQLDAEGLVRIELNRGAIVREVTAEEVYDLYQLRAMLESLAAERAAIRITPDQLADLQLSVSDFEVAVSSATPGDIGALREVSRANQRVHGAIVAASRHERLADLLRRTVDIPLVFSAFAQFDKVRLERSALFHRLIADAIAAGDSERAGLLIREHIYQGRDQLLLGMTGDQPGDQPSAAGGDGLD